MVLKFRDYAPKEIEVSMRGKILSVFGHVHKFDKIIGVGADCDCRDDNSPMRFVIKRCWCGTIYNEPGELPDNLTLMPFGDVRRISEVN